jgi:hypothetical protein
MPAMSQPPATPSHDPHWIFSLNENPDMRVGHWHWPDVRLFVVLATVSLALTWLFYHLRLGWIGEDRLSQAVHLAGLVTSLVGAPVALAHFLLPYHRAVIRTGLMKPVIWWRALAIMVIAALLLPALLLIWLDEDGDIGRFSTVVPGVAHLVAVATAVATGWYCAAGIVATVKYRARLWVV